MGGGGWQQGTSRAEEDVGQSVSTDDALDAITMALSGLADALERLRQLFHERA